VNSSEFKGVKTLTSYFDKEEKKIKRQIDLNVKKNYGKNSGAIIRQKENYKMMLELCLDYFSIIEEMLVLNGQNLEINVNHFFLLEQTKINGEPAEQLIEHI